MSIVLSTYITFNGTTNGDTVNTHLLRGDDSSTQLHISAFGNIGIHYDQVFITNLSTDPIRVTFDDFNDTKINAGEGFVVTQGTVGPINVHAQYNIKVKRHSGTGNVSYSILVTMRNNF